TASGGGLTGLAPEQSAGWPVDARADVYALAALAVHLLTGAPPFADAPSALRRQLHRFARRPELPASLPRPAHEVIARGLARAPDERPADVASFLAELREAFAVPAARALP